jgi:hypothetical protein
VKPLASSSKREPKSSPRPVRSHLPRCRGVGLRAVEHQLPLGRRVGAFQGPYRQVMSSDAHTGPPHRRHRPKRGNVVVRVTGTRHDEPTYRVRQSLPNNQEVPGHDHHTNRVRETGSGSHGPICDLYPLIGSPQHLDRSSGSRQTEWESDPPRMCARVRVRGRLAPVPEACSGLMRPRGARGTGWQAARPARAHAAASSTARATPAGRCLEKTRGKKV